MPDHRAALRRTISARSEAIPTSFDHPDVEPVSLSGQEHVNGLFEDQLLLAPPAALDLLACGAANWYLYSVIVPGMSRSIALKGAGQFVTGATGAAADHVGQGERQINALIASAQFLGEEGRHLQYLLTLRPWLHLATHRSHCRIFQDKAVVGIFDVRLSSYAYPVDKCLIDTSASSYLGIDGRMAWARPMFLTRPPGTPAVHFVAAHEQRRSFPLDLLHGAAIEHVYPGMHSDVGGGDNPREEGRSLDKGARDVSTEHPKSYCLFFAREGSLRLACPRRRQARIAVTKRSVS